VVLVPFEAFGLQIGGGIVAAEGVAKDFVTLQFVEGLAESGRQQVDPLGFGLLRGEK
jgi:hypothetical protein